METYNKNTEAPGRPATRKNPDHTGRVWGGLLIVIIGSLLLARKVGVDVPRWVFSFETIIIAIGLYIGLKHSFRGFFWLLPILIGGFLLLDDFFPQYDFHDFLWPVIIIGFGLFIMLRPSKSGRCGRRRDGDYTVEESTEDTIDSAVVFGGVKKNVLSKNFRGGEAVTVFGGTDINLMQAELQGPVVLELTQIFGGTKLLVPAHWKVQSKEMVAILGGIDDKRPIPANLDGHTDQVLILKGVCLFGGIDIKSY